MATYAKNLSIGHVKNPDEDENGDEVAGVPEPRKYVQVGLIFPQLRQLVFLVLVVMFEMRKSS